MGLTKQWIDELQEKAANGDAAIQEQMESVGLWSLPEELRVGEAAESLNNAETIPLPVFSLIYSNENSIHASNGIAGQIAECDFVSDLNESDRKRVLEFLENADVGETMFCQGVLVIRLKEDTAVACDCCS